jgi:hypothetical protein
VVFDPLAVILLLASQISFQNFREREKEPEIDWQARTDELLTIFNEAEGDSPKKESSDIVESTATVTSLDDDAPAQFEWAEQGPIVPEVEESLLVKHPYLTQPFAHFKNLQPMVYKEEGNSPPDPVVDVVSTDTTVTVTPEVERPGDYLDEPLFVQNEEQNESALWTSTLISKEEYLRAAASANLDPYNDAPHPEVAEYIDLVKSKRMALRDVPEEYIMAVKARI